MLTITQILILLAAGVGTGFASGLLGIGGGAVMVPVSYWLIVAMNVAPVIAIRIALGTSLLVIMYIFIAFMVYAGLEMIGVFSWIRGL